MSERYRFIAVYILASARNGTLYIGVTSDLELRMIQHRHGAFEGFAKRHGCRTLVWYEPHETMTGAIQRERSLKRYLRKWKLKLIEDANPEWRDLAADWFHDPDHRWDPDAGSSGQARG